MAGAKKKKKKKKRGKKNKKKNKTMELVFFFQKKRAILATTSSRPYSNYSWEVLEALSEYIKDSINPLFIKRDTKKVLIISITSSRGLCGGYNSQVIKQALPLLKINEDKQVDFISVGKKGETILRRLGQNVVASFNDVSAAPKLSEIRPILDYAIKLYKNAEYDTIFIVSTFFKSAILQVPITEQLLPVSKTKTLEDLENIKKQTVNSKIDYIFEPNYESIMNTIVEKIVRTKFFQMVLDSNASEQSARMVAMKNASDASGEMIDDLTLMFNKARQANITREISEISAGMVSAS